MLTEPNKRQIRGSS